MTSAKELVRRIRAGDAAALARAATLVENGHEAGTRVLEQLPLDQPGLIIGITGPPGAGKSTLVDRLIRELRHRNRTVGVVAVDPSSPFSRGALLGDRIRISAHHADPGVFVRSAASRGRLGGLGHATLELALLIAAAGYATVFVETVGIGQAEVEVAGLADLTAVVLVPGYGDDVQALKAGLVEVADLFVINKSDLPGAERLEQELRSMQSVAAAVNANAYIAPIRRVAALAGTGIGELMDLLEQMGTDRQRNANAAHRWAARLRAMVLERLSAGLPQERFVHYGAEVAAGKLTAMAAVQALTAELRTR